MMMIIADSGSTNTTWSLINEDSPHVETIVTAGINPFYQDEETILKLLQEEFRQLAETPGKVLFYGAGCINNDVNRIVADVLSSFFHCADIRVESDLMAAAHALCMNNEGIACILGTGSNSCYYNGVEIIRHVSPLGYILGDEGSGAVIGKRFIADLLKKQIPESIYKKFFDTYAYTPHQIMEAVYKKPFPNRFLAQFTRFIHDNLSEPSLRELVKTSFNEFFSRNISQYPESQHLPIHFTGSIAHNFRELLKDAAEGSGFRTGIITASPTDHLIQYHLKYD